MIIFLYMKNTILIPVVFLGNLILWAVLLSLVTVPASYASLMALSTGQFSVIVGGIISSALYLFPLSLMLTFIYLFFYLMRHRTILFMSLPLILVLAALSVIFLIPLSYRLSAAGMAYTATQSGDSGAPLSPEGSATLFSPGLIRDGDSGKRIFWLDDAGAGKRARGVVVADRSAMPGSLAMSVYPSADYDSATKQLSAQGALLMVPAGGKDPLIASRLEIPSFLSHLARDANFLLASFRAAGASGDVVYYAVVGSFFALLCCLYFVCHASGWRLLNTLLALTAFRFILMGYPHTTGGLAFDTARRFLPSAIPNALVSPAILSAATALSIIVGTAVFIVRKIKRSGEASFDD